MASDTRKHPPRTLSSPRTFLGKFVLPTGLIGYAATASIWVPSHVSAAVGMVPVVLMLVSIDIAAIAISLAVIPLKRVRMDADSLYVSNYRKEIAVPLSNVAEVNEFSATGHLNYRVLIRFHSTTALGWKVVFSPEEPGWTGAHRIAGEIRAAAARAARHEPA